MPLRVLGKAVETTVTINDILDRKDMAVRVAEIIEKKGSKIDGKVVCCLQREGAHTTASIDFLGSTDATTCVIVICYGVASHRASCAHLDTEVLDKADRLLLKIFSYLTEGFSTEDYERGIQVHMLGALPVPDHYGQDAHKIVSKLITLCHQSKKTFDVQTACVAQLNRRPKAKDIVPQGRDLFIQTTTGKVFIEPSLPRSDRGPDLVRRSLFFTVPSDQAAKLNAKTGGGLPYLLLSYDTEDDQYYVPPYTYEGLPDIDAMLKLSDRELLQSISTSPAAEGPNFVSEMRQVLSFLREHPDPKAYYAKHPPQHYQRRVKEENDWVPVTAAGAGAGGAASEKKGKAAAAPTREPASIAPVTAAAAAVRSTSPAPASTATASAGKDGNWRHKRMAAAAAADSDSPHPAAAKDGKDDGNWRHKRAAAAAASSASSSSSSRSESSAAAPAAPAPAPAPTPAPAAGKASGNWRHKRLGQKP